MATTAQAKSPSKARRAPAGPKEYLFNWEGKDKHGKTIRGEMRAGGESVVQATLRRQGIKVLKVKKQKMSKSGKVSEKDITLFTRQLATMMRAGVPLLQQAGILDSLLERLASYKEKILAIKGKIRSALFYPSAVVIVAVLVVTVIMLFVVPEFKSVFSSFGAELPLPTQIVINISEFMTESWYLIFGPLIAGIVFITAMYKRSTALQHFVDRLTLQLPVVGDIIRKATVARWTRTLSTMFAAGVPLVEALDSVGGASGNIIYLNATKQIQSEVSTGTSLTVSMQNADVFPNMVVQMVSIGEESGQLDSMLAKVSDFYEEEVDDAVSSLSSLLEPLIMVFLGVVVGGLIVALYMPIFKLGAIVG